MTDKQNNSTDVMPDGLIDGYQGIVQTWECDELNHLNVSHHFGRSSDSSYFMRHAMAMSPRALEAAGRGTVLLTDHVRFHNEAPLGCMLVGRGAPVAVAERTMQLYQELRNAEGQLITSFNGTIGCFDLQTRKLVAWTDATRARAEALKIAVPPYAEPARLAATRVSAPIALAQTKAQGFYRAGATGVNSWECDQFKHMNTMFYIRRQTEAVPHFWRHLGIGSRDLRGAKSGSVVGEMRITFLRELRAGDMVETWSALRGVAEKNLIAEHRLYNVETGELSALSHVCAVHFDLESRRAKPWADGVRARLADAVIEAG